MQRVVFRVLLCLALGVITTIAIAWGWMWLDARRNFLGPGGFVHVPETGDYLDGDTRVIGGYGGRHNLGLQVIIPSAQSADAPTAPGVTPRTEGHWPYWSDHRAIRTQDMFARMRTPQRTHNEIAVGIPFRALKARQHDANHFDASGTYRFNPAARPTYEYAIIMEGGLYVLPSLPIALGLLADTAIYCSAWWALLFGPGMFIRWRRTRGGRCVTCGYDLRGHRTGLDTNDRESKIIGGLACPECGARHSKASRH